MNFNLSEEDISFKSEVLNFATNLNGPDLISRDQQGVFSRRSWDKCAEFGIQGLAAPKRYGGYSSEVDVMRGVLAMESFGEGCKDNGLSLALNAQMWTLQVPLSEFGSESQCKKYLPELVGGNIIGAHAITEPKAGSDTGNLQCVAQKTSGGYVLTGEKCLITLGPIADIFLIFANTNPKLGKWGITAFLIEKGTKGLEVSDFQHKMGMRTVPIGELKLQNCFVSNDARLGQEGSGFSLMTHSLEYDRCCILASQLGAMTRQLKETLAYCKSRKQFGKKIKSFQSVSNRLADMRLRIESSRLLLYKVAWLKKNGYPAMLESAMLKLHLSENFVASSLDAIRCRGGQGYLTENEIERDMRDSIGGLLYAGTSDIQRNIISELIEME